MRDKPFHDDLLKKLVIGLAVVLSLYILAKYGILEKGINVKLPFFSFDFGTITIVTFLISIVIFAYFFVIYSNNQLKTNNNMGGNYCLTSAIINDISKIPYTIDDHNREHNTNFYGFSSIICTGSKYKIMENKVIENIDTDTPKTIYPDDSYDAMKSVTLNKSTRYITKWNTTRNSTFYEFSQGKSVSGSIRLPRGYGSGNYTQLIYDPDKHVIASVYSAGSDASQLSLPNGNWKSFQPNFGESAVYNFKINLCDKDGNIVLTIPNVGTRNNSINVVSIDLKQCGIELA